LERLACWCVHWVYRSLKIIVNVSLRLSLMSSRNAAQTKSWAVQFSELFISRLNGAAVTKLGHALSLGYYSACALCEGLGRSGRYRELHLTGRLSLSTALQATVHSHLMACHRTARRLVRMGAATCSSGGG